MRIHCCTAALFLWLAVPASAQSFGGSLDQLAATPLVTVHISEQLRMPPDEATISAANESREPAASAALQANNLKTERLLAAIRGTGIGAKDVQTQGVSVHPDYDYQTDGSRNVRRINGYVARNSVRIKTRQIDRLGGLLDTLTSAGATDINGPNFDIGNPAPLRSEARRRAMARGELEATEFARNAGFVRVRLLSVQEGVSYRASDIIVTGTRLSAPPPPAIQTVSTPLIAPGQIETGVTLTLVYRMER